MRHFLAYAFDYKSLMLAHTLYLTIFAIYQYLLLFFSSSFCLRISSVVKYASALSLPLPPSRAFPSGIIPPVEPSPVLCVELPSSSTKFSSCKCFYYFAFLNLNLILFPINPLIVNLDAKQHPQYYPQFSVLLHLGLLSKPFL